MGSYPGKPPSLATELTDLASSIVIVILKGEESLA
jgi:hypothetical protein